MIKGCFGIENAFIGWMGTNRECEEEEEEPFIHGAEALHSIGDRDFDLAYPDWIQQLSDTHWTPIEVARWAARQLVTEPGTRVLDIGCGPGKFCVVGAAITEGHFTGVEQRVGLAAAARQLASRYKTSRVKIIHSNITKIRFEEYDAFYAFNPFLENVFPAQTIDSDVDLLPELYTVYTRYVAQQLAQAPCGTRVVTYHGDGDEIPAGYTCERMACAGYLKLWIKRHEDQANAAAHEPEFSWQRSRMGAGEMSFA